MRPIHLSIACLIMITSCNIFKVDPEDPPLPDNLYFLELYNHSSHNIKIECSDDNRIFISYTLKAGVDTVINYQYYEEPILLLDTFGVSAEVIYDDDVSILHTRESDQAPSRSLFFLSSYKGDKVTDNQYIFSYEFTDADYEEAVLLGG